jgi:hypothetical protein
MMDRPPTNKMMDEVHDIVTVLGKEAGSGGITHNKER